MYNIFGEQYRAESVDSIVMVRRVLFVGIDRAEDATIRIWWKAMYATLV